MKRNTMTPSLSIHTRTALIERIAQGFEPRYLLFWGHQPEKDGSAGKGCFSQWFEAPFEIEGVRYATAEHFMMAGKARLFGDTEVLGQVLAARTPAEAKKLGRAVRGFDDTAWTNAAFDLVVEGNLAKFSQHAAMGEFLLRTGEQVLVEASPYDAIWGIGMAASHADAREPARWRGQNLLGFALMAVRDRLRAG